MISLPGSNHSDGVRSLCHRSSSRLPAERSSGFGAASRLGEWVEVQPSPLTIIEGVGSSRLNFARYIDFSLWVETDRSERFRRGIERDGEAMTAQWIRWMSTEDDYVAQEKPEKRADLVYALNRTSKRSAYAHHDRKVVGVLPARP